MLLEDPRCGVFSLLDEECVLPGGGSKAFTRKIFTRNATQSLIARPRPGIAGAHGRHLLEDEGILITHYAAPVLYDTTAFLQRNTATLPTTLQGLPSDHAFISTLLPNAPLPGAPMKQPSVSCHFRQQLSRLMDRLAATQCHFIRCIRPNMVLILLG